MLKSNTKHKSIAIYNVSDCKAMSLSIMAILELEYIIIKYINSKFYVFIKSIISLFSIILRT